LYAAVTFPGCERPGLRWNSLKRLPCRSLRHIYHSITTSSDRLDVIATPKKRNPATTSAAGLKLTSGRAGSA
ncbi:MAG: hypothetical protein Q8M47_11470, partial [Devosia sp.]|nr:hypothetical protein [Devosia sp.]